MKMDHESVIKLEEILFKSERMGVLLDCLQMMISEGPVEVRGIPENALNYSLYEICEGIQKNNDELRDLIASAWIIKKEEGKEDVA